MALIPRIYMDTLVTISVNNKNDEKFCIGTGFLVGKFIKEENNNENDKKKEEKIYKGKTTKKEKV